jgi:hypothetical protein
MQQQQQETSNKLIYAGIALAIIAVLVIMVLLWTSNSITDDAQKAALDRAAARAAEAAKVPPPVYVTELCGHERDPCTVGSSGKVMYLGKGVSMKKFTAGQNIGCNNNEFGDPIYGVVKACYTSTSSDPYNFTKCASEGGNCIVGPQGEVLYGSQASTVLSFSPDRTINCDNGGFGDPLYGKVKSCYTGDQK